MKSVILIGMPGAGKTTLGKKLAKQLSFSFFDTDRLIEVHTGLSLQRNLDALGYLAMRKLEGDLILQHSWPEEPMVIATGGSAVYSDEAMQCLCKLGLCVYLNIRLETIKARVKNWRTRGFLAAPDQSLESVFDERQALYRQFGEVVIDCDDLTKERCLQLLIGVHQASADRSNPQQTE